MRSTGNIFRIRRRGFTLLEVLVAVVILGFAATACFRLMVMSGHTLSEVQVRRELLNKAREMQFSSMYRDFPESGKDSDTLWKTRKIIQPVMNGKWQIAYRKLDLSYKGRTITVYLP